MLVVGGGYIGLEMATAYSSLGTKVDVVEFLPRLLPGADIDLVEVLEKKLRNKLSNIYLNTKVTSISDLNGKVDVIMKTSNEEITCTYDKVLISVGRAPNTDNIAIENTGIILDEKGFIQVDEYRRTNIDNIFAIGDITGNPMLAHKATHEGKVAAEVCNNIPSAFEPQVIPPLYLLIQKLHGLEKQKKNLKKKM